jgi:hypothetical protein
VDDYRGFLISDHGTLFYNGTSLNGTDTGVIPTTLIDMHCNNIQCYFVTSTNDTVIPLLVDSRYPLTDLSITRYESLVSPTSDHGVPQTILITRDQGHIHYLIPGRLLPSSFPPQDGAPLPLNNQNIGISDIQWNREEGCTILVSYS